MLPLIRPVTLVFLFCCTLALTSPVPVQKELPPYIHVCNRNDKAMESCIRENIEEIKPKLKDGIPELKIPKLEPLYIKELVAADTTALKISTKDLYVYGGSDFNIGQIQMDPKKHEFKFEIGFPHIKLDGKYNVDGKIMLNSINGHGNITGDIYDIKANITLHGNKMEKEGITVAHFTDMKIKLKVSKGKVHLTNLFNGDKQLGEMINTVINQNFEAFAKELSPLIEQTLSKLLLPMIDGIVESFPYDSLFRE
uniref:Protein takeout n=1 Tax=Cacopsylla melanoneura TaxID=428564 RepID=A0A8D9BCW9_9HEMI